MIRIQTIRILLDKDADEEITSQDQKLRCFRLRAD